MLARPLYRYARFELKAVPKAQRQQALGLQIRQWAPFGNPRWYLVWDGDTAQVWAWDADLVDAVMRAQPIKPANAHVIPETLLHTRRQQDACLVACLEGCEGQVWRDGALLASRWWPQLPEISEWRNFQRGIGGSADTAAGSVPPLLPAGLQDQPWAKSAATRLSSTTAGGAERWATTATTLCLAAATFWYGAQLLKLQDAIAAQTVELENLNQQSSAILEARSQALETLDRIRQLQSLDSSPSHLGLLAKVAGALPNDGAYLREWDFQSGKLKLQIVSPNKLAGSEIIKQFQAAGIFDNVLATPGNEPTNMLLSMDLKPHAVIAFAGDGGDSAKKQDGAKPGDKALVLVPPLR